MVRLAAARQRKNSLALHVQSVVILNVMRQTDTNQWGPWIKARAQFLGLKLKAIASRTGVDPSTVSRWLSRSTMPTIRRSAEHKLASLLHVDVTLLGSVHEMYRPDTPGWLGGSAGEAGAGSAETPAFGPSNSHHAAEFQWLSQLAAGAGGVPMVVPNAGQWEIPLTIPRTAAIVVTTARLTAPDPIILWANDAFREMTEYGLFECIGKSPRMLQGPRTSPVVLRQFKAQLQAQGFAAMEVINYTKSNEPYLCRVAAIHLPSPHDPDGVFVALERRLPAPDDVVS